ncbi:MAG: HEAT repeat domain-containing protein [Longimicrobiales bacterium]|nr:HEAT repeat domain-containing protein [Longimicrobiales bacterium]
MTDTPDARDLSPFARSIASLFAAPGDGDEGSISIAGAARGSTPTGEAATGEEGAELRRAVGRYFSTSDAAQRAEAEAELRSLYQEGRRLRLVEVMADTIAALARLGGTRPEALELARDLLGPVVASALVTRVLEAPPDSRADRARLLASLGDEAVRAVITALGAAPNRKIRRALVDLLIRVGPASPQAIGEMVENGDDYAVRNAVLVLGEAGDESALQHLTGTIAHHDPRVRRESVLALQKIGGEGAGILVLARLEDADSSVRAAAARAVGALNVERGVRALLACLQKEKDDDVIIATCRALGTLNDPAAVPALEKKAVGSFLSRPPTTVRIAAYQALAAIGTPHARKLLDEAREDRDPEVRAVVEGLGQA